MSAQEVPEPAARTAETGSAAEAAHRPGLGRDQRLSQDKPTEPGTVNEREPVTDQVAELQQRVAELDDRWRRVAAELDNTRKRHAREAERLRGQERGRVAAAFLPVLDSLDLALDHAAADPSAIMEGVRAVRDQALNVLAQLGYPRRDDVGAPFDPTQHEAVATAPASECAPGTVLQVIRPGYGEGKHQLRPAAVVVADASTTEGASAAGAPDSQGRATGRQ